MEEHILKAGNWTWFRAVSQDNFNYRFEEGLKRIQYDDRIWNCIGTIPYENIRATHARMFLSGTDCRFVLVHKECLLTGRNEGKAFLLYVAPFKELQLDDEV